MTQTRTISPFHKLNEPMCKKDEVTMTLMFQNTELKVVFLI